VSIPNKLYIIYELQQLLNFQVQSTKFKTFFKVLLISYVLYPQLVKVPSFQCFFFFNTVRYADVQTMTGNIRIYITNGITRYNSIFILHTFRFKLSVSIRNLVRSARVKFESSGRYIKYNILTTISLVGTVHTVYGNVAPVVRRVTVRLVPMVLAARQQRGFTLGRS